MAVPCLETAQDFGACSDANTNRGFLLEAATTRTAKQSPGVPASSSASLHKPRLRHQPHKGTPVVAPLHVLTPPSCRLCTTGSHQPINPAGCPHQSNHLSSPYFPLLALQKTLTRPDAFESHSQVPSHQPRLSATLPTECHHPQNGPPRAWHQTFSA